MELLTIEEVADKLKISRSLTYRLIKENKIKTFKIGRSYRITKKELNSYINRSTIHASDYICLLA